MKTTVALVSVALLLVITGGVCFWYYPYVFAKNVNGEVVSVERVSQPGAIFASGAAIPASQIYSFAIAIKDQNGEIHTASTEDRQWAVAQAGQCAEAKYLRYPFWEFDKSGTFFGARLLRLYDCPKGARPVGSPQP